MSGNSSVGTATFWEHLDDLRRVLMRIAAGVLSVSVIAFCFKEELFNLILAPKSDDFITYRLLSQIEAWIMQAPLTEDIFSVQLINTQLAHTNEK